MPRAVPQAILDSYGDEDNPLDLVVTVDAAGQQRRFSTQAYRIPGAERDVQVDGGLMESPEVPPASASVRDGTLNLSGDTSVRVQQEGAAWLLAMAARAPVQRARVEVALVDARRGPWEGRMVLHEGVLRSPAWDIRGGWVSFRVAQEAADGRGMVPPFVVPQALPAGGTPERSRGVPMQVLYGLNVFNVATVALLEATDDNRLLVAAHAVRAASITVHREDSDGLTSDLTETPVNAAAGVLSLFGLVYSYVVLADTEYWQDTPTKTRPWVFSLDAHGKLGSNPVSAATSELHLLGEVLLDILTSYSQMSVDRIDVESFKALDATLAIEVVAQVTQQDSALGWVQKIVQDLPVRVEWVGGRLTALPAALRMDAPPAVVARLRWGFELVDLVQPYEQDSADEVANDVTVQYRYRNRTGTYTKTLQLAPENDAACAGSAARHGRRALSRQIELWQVDAEDAAHLVAAETVARLAYARTRCAYLADSRAVLHLRPLDVVEVEDAGQGVVGQLFYVEEIAPGETRSVVRLVSRAELEVTWDESS